MDQIQKDTESTKKDHQTAIGKLKETHEYEIEKITSKLNSVTLEL